MGDGGSWSGVGARGVRAAFVGADCTRRGRRLGRRAAAAAGGGRAGAGRAGVAVEAAAGADCCLRSISHIARCSSVSDCANASASASGLGSPGGDAFTGDALLPRRRAPFAFDGDNFASAPGWNRFASFMAVSFSVSGINSCCFQSRLVQRFVHGRLTAQSEARFEVRGAARSRRLRSRFGQLASSAGFHTILTT